MSQAPVPVILPLHVDVLYGFYPLERDKQSSITSLVPVHRLHPTSFVRLDCSRVYNASATQDDTRHVHALYPWSELDRVLLLSIYTRTASIVRLLKKPPCDARYYSIYPGPLNTAMTSVQQAITTPNDLLSRLLEISCGSMTVLGMTARCPHMRFYKAGFSITKLRTLVPRFYHSDSTQLSSSQG
jgi:hypothetical protein